MARIGSVLFLFLARAEEMFAETRTRAREVHCLRRADAAFFRGENQLVRGRWSTADRVGVRVRGSKGDQLRKGAIYNSSEVWSAATGRSRGRCRRFNYRVDVVLFYFSPRRPC